MLPGGAVTTILQKSCNCSNTEHIVVISGQGISPPPATELRTLLMAASKNRADSTDGDPSAPSSLATLSAAGRDSLLVGTVI